MGMFSGYIGNACKVVFLSILQKAEITGHKNNILTVDEKADIMQSISGKFHKEMKSNEKKK